MEAAEEINPKNLTSAQSSANWKTALRDEREKPYFKQILSFVESERAKGKQVFPKNSDIFSAFASTPLESVRVVIIGQDPYHGPGQAHGLSFSVQKGVRIPPSLVNIYKEMQTDLGIEAPQHGLLADWASQGVLLLNSVLTVEAHKAGSHANIGWETFTDAVIEKVNTLRNNVVFFLWGSYAQKKGKVINRSRHLVIESPHPSPLSAHRGFFGSKPFSKANNYLQECGLPTIDWSLT